MADYAISGARLQPIYERLNSAPRYHPIEAETFADWSMEAGDIVTITRDGQSYESPVQTSVVKWRKGQRVSVSSGGNQQRDAVSKVSQNKYSRASGGAGLRNSQHNVWRFESQYNELAAGLIITASGLYTYAHNQYTGLSSGLTQTASAITAFVNSRYDEMSAGLEITSSSISQYVEDRYRDMRAGLDITSSSFHAYVEDRYRDMRSGLDITSSSLHAYVRSRYEDMQAGLALTSSSAALYVQKQTTRARIIARINGGTGHSEALIEAENVQISGTTTINDIMTISEGRVYIKSPLRVEGDAMMGSLTIRDGSSSETITQTILAGMIKSAAVENNVLTLTPVHGDPITFSKATSLTGAWSGNKCTVTASQNGTTVDTWSVGFTNDADSMISIDTNGAATALPNVRKSISVPLRVIETKGTTQTNVYTKDQTVNATVAWNNGWDDAKEKIAMPASGGTAETFTVKVPNTARTGQTNRLFKLVKGSTPGPTGYASVVLFPEGSDGSGNGNLVGRIDIGDWYTAGKAAGSGGGAATVSNVSTQNDQWSPTGTQAGYVGYSSLVRNGYISFRVAVSGGSTTTWYIKINP